MGTPRLSHRPLIRSLRCCVHGSPTLLGGLRSIRGGWRCSRRSLNSTRRRTRRLCGRCHTCPPHHFQPTHVTPHPCLSPSSHPSPPFPLTLSLHCPPRLPAPVPPTLSVAAGSLRLRHDLSRNARDQAQHARQRSAGPPRQAVAAARRGAHTHTHAHTHAHTRTHAHAHAHTRTHMHTHARTRTHTSSASTHDLDARQAAVTAYGEFLKRFEKEGEVPDKVDSESEVRSCR